MELAHSVDEPVVKDGDGTEAAVRLDDIVVIVEEGEVTSVWMNGVQVRATVHDYDVEFPIPAGQTEIDENGIYFKPIIV